MTQSTQAITELLGAFRRYRHRSGSGRPGSGCVSLGRRGSLTTMSILLCCSVGFATGTSPSHAASRCVEDDTGAEICLSEPAQRVVALSPGVTELLFAAGGGDRVVAAVSHADYPAQAEKLPRVGSYNRIDIEAVLAQRPDLVVGWLSGNSPSQLERLERLGLTVYRSEQRELADIATTLERLGTLLDSEREAEETAESLRARLAELEARYAASEPVEVFYQVWADPIITVNDTQIISEAIRLCGGRNLFGELERLTPRLDVESILAADPQAIVAGGMGEASEEWLEQWRKYPDLSAVKNDHLFFVPPSKIQRPTPRMLDGIEILCDQLEEVR